MNLTLIQQICVWILPVLFAITIHEAAHGYVAYKLGDPTAKLLGRVSINPLVHIDPIGTIAVPLLVGILSNFQFVFGWAKPVPITYQNFKNKRRDISLVSIAGPVSNILMAILWAIFLKIIVSNFSFNDLSSFLVNTAKAGIIINVVLFALNILPIPPLDGSKIASSLMPPKYAYHYDKIEPYGFIILMVLMFTNILQYILLPIISTALNFVKILINL
jgi:Zn-dependent protease